MDNRLPLLFLLAMFSSILSAQPVYVPQELREPPEYVLPGSRYGILHGASIPHFLSTEGDHRGFLRVLMAERHEIDVLSLDSGLWGLTVDTDDLPQGWRFEWAGQIQCPAAFCLLLGTGGGLNWIVTADNEYRVLDIALIGEVKYGVAEGGERYRRLAIMDSVFGWGGEQALYPLDFADTGIFCTNYLHNPSGSDGLGRNFMRQILPDGRILTKELTDYRDCIDYDPITPIYIAQPKDNLLTQKPTTTGLEKAASGKPEKGLLTFEAEGSPLAGSRFYSRKPHVLFNQYMPDLSWQGLYPGTRAGLILGRGFDLAHYTSDDTKAVLKRIGFADGNELDLLVGAAGLRSTQIRNFFRNHYEKLTAIELTAQQEVLLFQQTYLEASQLAKQLYQEQVKDDESPAWEQLNSRIQEVLVDMAHRGDFLHLGELDARDHPELSAAFRTAVIGNNPQALCQVFASHQTRWEKAYQPDNDASGWGVPPLRLVQRVQTLGGNNQNNRLQCPLNPAAPLLAKSPQTTQLVESSMKLPKSLRNLPEFILPSTPLGLLHGTSYIPAYKEVTNVQVRQLLNRLLHQEKDIDVLWPGSGQWPAASTVPTDAEENNMLHSAARVACPAAHCVLLGTQSLRWLVVADRNYQVTAHTLLAAMEESFDQQEQRYRMQATLDTAIGWSILTVGINRGDFETFGYACSFYQQESNKEGEAGATRYFMQQVTHDGRILMEERSDKSNCWRGIEPLLLPDPDADV